jgi:hypothetical protein
MGRVIVWVFVPAGLASTMRILDDLRPLRTAQAALPFVGYVLVLVCSGLIILFPAYFHEWAIVGAKLIGVGASTALFTRFLGGMGMFKDAISDVLGEDRWLDRRSDLADLWRRISRRLFLPGFDENAAGSEEFLAEFNKAMTKTVLRSAGRYHGYYEKDARRVIELTWLDPENKILRLQDELRCDVIVFSQQTEIYEIKCTATAGLGIDSYKLSVTASVNNVTAKPSGDSADGRSIFRLEVPHTTNPNKFHRAIAAEQAPLTDPTYYVICGHVTWGMNIIVRNRAPGLRVSWEEIGVDAGFSLENNSSDFLQLVSEDILFPDQGVILVLTVDG